MCDVDVICFDRIYFSLCCTNQRNYKKKTDFAWFHFILIITSTLKKKLSINSYIEKRQNNNLTIRMLALHIIVDVLSKLNVYNHNDD